MKCSIHGYVVALLILVPTLFNSACTSRKAVTLTSSENDSSPAQTAPGDERPSNQQDSTASQQAQPVLTQKTLEKPLDESTPVATLQDRVITGGQLRERIIKEIRPDPYTLHPDQSSVAPEDIIDLMLRETAMVLDAREQGLLNDPNISWNLERDRASILINQLATSVIRDQVTVTDEQIEAQLQQTPKLDRDRARQVVENRAIRAKIVELTKQLVDTLHVQKHKDNFAKAALVYRRLLLHPKMDRPKNTPWMLKQQVLHEVDPNEADMALATFTGGPNLKLKFTLLNLLQDIHGIIPPKRPRDLTTPSGVERFLDQALNRPLLAAYARSLDLDKNEDVVKRIRDREDRDLLGQIRMRKTKDLAYPTEDEIKAYFDRIKETVKMDETITAKIIWCPDREAAKTVRQMLDEGRSFDQMKADYASPDQEQKQAETVTLSSQTEGRFWKDLWSADPNTVVGPLPGFSKGQFQWRVVKVLEKIEGKPLELNAHTSDMISGQLFQAKREQALLPYQKKLLEKYEHHIFADRLNYFNPLK